MSDNSNKLSKIMLPLLLIACFAAVVVLQLGFIFILLGMLPTLAAYFMDNYRGFPLFKTVAACNLSALLPIISPMFEAVIHGDSFDPKSLIINPINWLIVYGGAILGWLLIFLCKIIGSFVMTLIYEYRIASLERMQKNLIEEWGQNIKG